MRSLFFLGLGLAAFGAYLFVWGLSYSSNRSIIEVGDFKASVEERRTTPTWVGGGVLAVGVALMIVGIRRRSPPHS